MPHIAIYDMQGEKTSDVEVPDTLLGLPYNADLVRQAVVAVDYARKRRCGKAKTRSEVVAVGAKWYRQKGLGRARHGARSAPVFVGGGKAHGPVGVQSGHKIPKRMRRKAAAVALSQRVRERAFTLVDSVELEEISTRALVDVLASLGLEGRILMLVSPDEAKDEVLYKSSRNIADLIVRPVPHFSARDIVRADEILMTQDGLTQLMEGGADNAE